MKYEKTTSKKENKRHREKLKIISSFFLEVMTILSEIAKTRKR